MAGRRRLRPSSTEDPAPERRKPTGARTDSPVAVIATTREFACLVHTMFTRSNEYVERGMHAYERRRVDRSITKLGRRAQQWHSVEQFCHPKASPMHTIPAMLRQPPRHHYILIPFEDMTRNDGAGTRQSKGR